MASETADVVAATAPTSYVPEMAEVAADSPDAMWDLLAERGLGDGLPVVPPTAERVEAMLEHAEPATPTRCCSPSSPAPASSPGGWSR